MIPVRLQLKNFMSYGESVPPLEMAGIRLACLSGDNGNGKTALLDAMTWALFGETRASSEDDVIRAGASDVRVLFDFIVENNKYRVHKQRGKRGGSVWELQVWQEDGTTRSLSGTSARETKARIESLLRMDYKTFLATAYLAQGRADEFARSSVADRKKVLADILDLGRYERLEQLAKDRRVEAEAREIDAEREIRAIDNELLNEDGYVLSLEEAQKRLESVAVAIEAVQREAERLAAEVQRLDELEERAREYEGRIPDIQDEIGASARALAEINQRVALAEQVWERRAEIEASHAALVAVEARIKPLEAQYDQVIALERQQHELENTVRAEHDKIDRERYRLECDVDGLLKEASELGRFDAEVTYFDAEIARFGEPERRRTETEAARLDADDALVTLKAEHAVVKTQIDILQKRIDALRSSNASLCDYCGQPLSPSKRQQAVTETETGQAALRQTLDELGARGREAKKQSEQFRQASEQAQTDLRSVSRLETQRAHATQEQLRLSERTKALPDLRARLDRFVKRLAERDYAHEAQERLMKVSAQREKMERVAEALAAARTERARYENAERDLLQLRSAEQVMTTEPPRAGELKNLIAKREGQIEKARKQIEAYRVKTAALPLLRGAQREAAAQLAACQNEAQTAQREIGQFAALLERCAKQKGERVRRAGERSAAAREKEVYKELAGAFGKKGVQALIIENAIPEITEAANQILSKMTQGAMQVQLLTQREAKTKNVGAIETLDIIISDEMGQRPYEMFSGGEAFRVNFALRVALSKMLARRAGAPLQTLILDEGFGTQDPRGREAILDALTTVSDDFALVLVITHIEELKENFQTRIEVVKGPDGSTFTVA